MAAAAAVALSLAARARGAVAGQAAAGLKARRVEREPLDRGMLAAFAARAATALPLAAAVAVAGLAATGLQVHPRLAAMAGQGHHQASPGAQCPMLVAAVRRVKALGKQVGEPEVQAAAEMVQLIAVPGAAAAGTH